MLFGHTSGEPQTLFLLLSPCTGRQAALDQDLLTTSPQPLGFSQVYKSREQGVEDLRVKRATQPESPLSLTGYVTSKPLTFLGCSVSLGRREG